MADFDAGLPAPRPPTPQATTQRPGTAGGANGSRSASAPRPSSAGGNLLRRTGPVNAQPVDKIYSRKHCYPVAREQDPTPQTPAEQARVDRARDKQQLLRAPFLSRWEDEDGKVEKKGLPRPFVPEAIPFWSPAVHGTAMVNVTVPDSQKDRPTGAAAVKRRMHELRKSLLQTGLEMGLVSDPKAAAAFASGTVKIPASQEMSIIRAQVSDVETAMRAHLQSLCDRRNQYCQAPAISPKDLLMRAFRAADASRAALAADREAARRSQKAQEMANRQRRREGKPEKPIVTAPPASKGKSVLQAMLGVKVKAGTYDPSGARGPKNDFELGHKTSIPDKLLTGDVTVSEFCDVWNLYLELKAPNMEMKDGKPALDQHGRVRFVTKTAADGTPQRDARGHEVYEMAPLKVTKAHAAALFLRYGFDYDGLMPYAVFASALTTGPARLLGMRDIMDQRARNRNGFDRGDNVKFDGQILYAKQRGSVFAPSSFDTMAVKRSSKAPTASLQLEHVYGYAGNQGLANNIYFLEDSDEIVYYVAAVGIVYQRTEHRQRFFFGHDNDIRCIGQHPKNFVVATGQNKAIGGDDEVPYVCVWDTRTMCELQRLHMPPGSRAVVAVGFSPGAGNTLVTITSDNPHSLFVWDWMTDLNRRKIIFGGVDLRGLPWDRSDSKKPPKAWMKDKYYRVQERYEFNKPAAGMAAPTWPPLVEGWRYGPEKRLADLENSKSGFFFTAERWPKMGPPDIYGNEKQATDKDGALLWEYHPFVGEENGVGMSEAQRRCVQATKSGRRRPPPSNPNAPAEMPPDEKPRRYDGIFKKEGETFMLLPKGEYSAMNGSPPQVYEVVWNPWKLEKLEDKRGVRPGLHGTPGKFVKKNYPAYKDAVGADDEQWMHSEFVTYGIKHVKFWNLVASGENVYEWTCESGIFKPEYVQNVVSAVFIKNEAAPYLQPMDPRRPDGFQRIIPPTGAGFRARLDKDPYMLVTGFPSGDIGLWSQRVLVKLVAAHDPGVQRPLPDGTLAYDGVRALNLVDDCTLLSAGADGTIITWDVSQSYEKTVRLGNAWLRDKGYEGNVSGDVCVPLSELVTIEKRCRCKGRQGPLLCLDEMDPTAPTATAQPVCSRVDATGCVCRWVLRSPYKDEAAPAFRGLDCISCESCSSCTSGRRSECAAFVLVSGTNNSDIWEISRGQPSDPLVLKCLVDGHTADVMACATHPTKETIFATAAAAPRVYLWDTRKKAMIRTCNVGFAVSTLAFSANGAHLAVGSANGRIKVLHAATLQPLDNFKDSSMAISCIKYAPNNRYMAVGSHDLDIYIYETGFPEQAPPVPGGAGPSVEPVWDAEKCYRLVKRFEGHAATISSMDFSEPLLDPPHLRGHTILSSTCNGRETLNWSLDPSRLRAAQQGHGRPPSAQVVENMRDIKYVSRNSVVGFDLMGIWPDGVDFYEMDSLDRSRTREYAATGDHFSTIKLFNYPVVWNDAPFREYRGHASFVTAVRFTCSDRHLISVGGGDRAAFQYATHGINKEDAGPQHAKEWCDVDLCTFCARQPARKSPAPSWGPLDAEGKAFGPVPTDPVTGKCLCEFHEKHLELMRAA